MNWVFSTFWFRRELSFDEVEYIFERGTLPSLKSVDEENENAINMNKKITSF